MTILYACSGYKYFAIESEKSRFGKYHTFSWLPIPDSSHYHNDIIDEKIKDETTYGLEKLGLTLRNELPDLLVRYTIQVKDRVRIYNYPTYVYGPRMIYRGVAKDRYGRYFYYYYSNPFPVYVGSDIIQTPYKEGTLIIDLIERESHHVIWRGYGTGNVDNPERAMRDIPIVVNGILNTLPIAQKVKSN